MNSFITEAVKRINKFSVAPLQFSLRRNLTCSQTSLLVMYSLSNHIKLIP